MERITDRLYFVLNVAGGHQVILTREGRILPVVRGGSGDDGDPIEVPDDLAEMDEATARDLHAKLQAKLQAGLEEARKSPSTEQVANLQQIRATMERLGEHVTKLVSEQAENAQALEALAQPVALPDAAVPAAADSSAPAGDAAPPATTPEAQAASTMPVTAGLSGAPAIGAGQTDAVRAAASATPARPRASYVAAAGQTEVQQGVVVDFEQMGRMIDQAKRLDGSKGFVTAHVAALPAFEDMAEFSGLALSRGDGPTATDRKIREAVEDWKLRTGRMSDREKARLGRTAAICEPLDIIREIPDCSMDADPFGDSLPQRPAGRLGFQFTQAISLSAVSGGVTGKWSETSQSFVDPTDPTTWKPCVDIDCPAPESVRAEEVVACARFDVTTEMSNPERVQDVLAKLAALRVRARTQALLAKADALSSAYTFTSTYDLGAFPAVVEASMSVVARAIYDERLDPTDYNLYLPPGLVELLVTDLVGRAYVDQDAGQQAAADVVAQVEAVTGLRTVRLWDVIGNSPFDTLNPPGEAAVALPVLGCNTDDDTATFLLRFIAPEAALYFSTGEEKTGLESSPELLRQNKVQFFSREFVGLAKHGCHPWFTVLASLSGDGSRMGFSSPVPCT